MKNGRMQCKDIPDYPVLSFLWRIPDRELVTWGGSFFGAHNIDDAMPYLTPDKLARVKMGMLIRRGLMTGCACGCSGNFHLSKTGREFLVSLTRSMVFDSLDEASGNGHEYVKSWSVPEIVADLISYCSDFEDSEFSELSPYVQEWKDKQHETLSNSA